MLKKMGHWVSLKCLQANDKINNSNYRCDFFPIPFGKCLTITKIDHSYIISPDIKMDRAKVIPNGINEYKSLLTE